MRFSFDRQLPPSRPGLAHLPLFGIHDPRAVGHRASICVDRRIGRMRYGCRRVQSQVVCRLPRPRLEHFQRVREQLVERPLCSPSA